MLIKILKPDFEFEDERGSLTQLVRTGYTQVNVITSVADSLRGGHYHEKNEEAFYIITGKLKLEVAGLEEGVGQEEYVFSAGDMFQIPRGIVHSFYFAQPTTLVSMYSGGVEQPGGVKDIINVDLGNEPKKKGEKEYKQYRDGEHNKKIEEINYLKEEIHRRDNEYKMVCKKLQKKEILIELLKQDAEERDRRIERLRMEWMDEKGGKKGGGMGIFDSIFVSKAELISLQRQNDRLIEHLIALEDQLIEQQKKLKKNSDNIVEIKSVVRDECESVRNWSGSLFHEKHEMILQAQSRIDHMYQSVDNINQYVDQLGRHVETVRNEIYENIAESKEESGRLFHEKHEMIMKEHQNVLEILRWEILQYYYNKDVSDEVKQVLRWLECHNIRMLPYDFVDSYIDMNIDVIEENGWLYVLYAGRKLYFPRSFSEAEVKDYYQILLAEQDENSPHKYFDKSYNVTEESIFIDVGAAEGFIGLCHIDEVQKLILIEADIAWVEALKKTFEPYADKVQIVHSYASDKHGDTETTLDEFMDEVAQYVIKIDVEGAEMKVLSGIKVEKLKAGSKIAVCAYHRQEDEDDLGEYLKRNNFYFKHTDGFVLSTWGGYREPFLRRGVMRGEIKRG